VKELKAPDMEANPEAREPIVERQEVRNAEMSVDAIGR
jgi:hypothetical protein